MDNKERRFLIAISAALSPARVQDLRLLTRHLGGYSAAWKASESRLVKSGLSLSRAKKIASFRRQYTPQRLMRILAGHKINALTRHDKDYPEGLRSIPSPPPVLFVKGSVAALRVPHLAVVGSRRASAYGVKTAELFARYFINQGLGIVSGFAYGIDQAAHRAALDNNGVTIAVLPGGLDEKSIYPRGKYGVAEKIIRQGGALVSEYWLGSTVRKQTFLERNRLISGLSIGVLIPECAQRSGALITARHALEQGREVAVVPGSIYSELSRGPHCLLEQGALIAYNPKQLHDSLNLGYSISQKSLPSDLPPAAKQLVEAIRQGADSTELLAEATGLQMKAILQALTELELAGRLAKLDNGKLILNI